MKYTKITNTEVTEAIIDYICDISLNMTELTKFYVYEIQDHKINFNIINQICRIVTSFRSVLLDKAQDIQLLVFVYA